MRELMIPVLIECADSKRLPYVWKKSALANADPQMKAISVIVRSCREKFEEGGHRNTDMTVWLSDRDLDTRVANARRHVAACSHVRPLIL